jgi:hypothetical protein
MRTMTVSAMSDIDLPTREPIRRPTTGRRMRTRDWK